MYKHSYIHDVLLKENETDDKNDLTFGVKSIEFLNSEDPNKPKRAKIIIVESGWNLNDIYIEDSVLDELILAIPQKPKLFVDHDLFAYFGRSNKDWLASFEPDSIKKVDNTLEGTIVFTENPQTTWLYDEMKKDPAAIQFSIHVRGVLVEYKDVAQNREGYRMTQLKAYKSTDAVSYAAAGGKGIEVLNAMLTDKLDKFKNFLNKNEESQEMEVKNIAELRTAYPGFVAELIQSEQEPLKSTISTLQTEKDTLQSTLDANTNKITELTSKVEEVTNSLNAVTKEKDDLKLEVDNYKLKESQSAWKTQVETEITNAELPEKSITDVFKESLFKESDIEEVKKLINDRKEVFNSSLNVINNGTPPKEKKEVEEVNLDQIASDIKN